MYEDHTIEEKYLGNFSRKEKQLFLHEQQKWWKDQLAYRTKLEELLATDSPAIFDNYEPYPNTALEIKYILNRIAANDPRDKKFELAQIDAVSNPDKLALDIAKAFQTNTSCRTVTLQHIGLTNAGILPILSVLRRKELDLLDIRGNKTTKETYTCINEILSDPKTKWRVVYFENAVPNQILSCSRKLIQNSR